MVDSTGDFVAGVLLLTKPKAFVVAFAAVNAYYILVVLRSQTLFLVTPPICSSQGPTKEYALKMF